MICSPVKRLSPPQGAGTPHICAEWHSSEETPTGMLLARSVPYTTEFTACAYSPCGVMQNGKCSTGEPPCKEQFDQDPEGVHGRI